MFAGTEQMIEHCLRDAATSSVHEQRTRRRFPFFRSVALIPDSHTQREFPAFSRDISPGGVGLLHRPALDTDRLVVRIPTRPDHSLDVPVQIQWTTPAGIGWHFSGGSFLELSTRARASLLATFVQGEASRRFQQRHPFFHPMTIITGGSCRATISAFSRDISPGGIGLLHPVPLEPGRINLQDSATGGQNLDLSIDIGWCAPVGEELFMSGGRFIRLMLEEAPLRFL